MKRFSASSFVRIVALSLVVWMIAAAVGVLVGSTGQISNPDWDVALLRFKEHVFVASLVGSALAMSGVAYQAILRNPLADPYLLGASGGAMLATYIWRLQGIAGIAFIGTVSPHAFAMAGALIAIAVVLVGAGWRGRLDPVSAVLVGVIVNAICGAIFMLLNSIYSVPPGSGGPLSFMVGDIQTTASHGQIVTSVIIVVISAMVLLGLGPVLNIVRLSEDEALSLGVNVQRARWVGLITASLMTAAGVAVSGPIGFVGLICPHIARWIVGNDNRKLLPLSAAMGAGMLVIADVIARVLLSRSEVGTLVPVGVITALLGGPFFLLLLMRTRR